MSSRAIKQELLEAVAPDIYRRRRVKKERRAPFPLKEEALVKLEKAERKVKGARKRRSSGTDVPLPDDGFEDDEPILEFASAPRRPYQWRGRRVRRVLRPGVVVSFNPGQRSAVRTAKRAYDEVYADEDLLAAAAAREGEFSYGKRSRDAALAEVLPSVGIPEPAYVVLDDVNTTPSLKPLTEQKVIPTSTTLKRGLGVVQPTIQVLAKKRRMGENGDEGGDSSVAEVKMREVKPVAADLGIQTVDVKVPDHSAPMEVVQSLSRAARVAQRLARPQPATTATAVATSRPVAVSKSEPMETVVADAHPAAAAAAAATALLRRAPATRSAGTQTEGTSTPVVRLRTSARSRRTYPRGMLPYYVLHPSIIPTPGYRGTRYVTARRPRRRAVQRRRRGVSRRAILSRAADLLPGVRYHPSIRQSDTVARLRRL